MEKKTETKKEVKETIKTTAVTTTFNNENVDFDSLDLNLSNLNAFFDVLEDNKEAMKKIDLSKLTASQSN